MAKKIDTRWAAECEVRFMKALRGKIESMTDEEEAIRDTLEGSSDVDGVMETLIGLRQEACAIAISRRKLAKQYQEAAQADEARAEKVEALILECLQVAGQDKWSGVAGTASIRKGGYSTDVHSPMLVPLQYQKAVPDVMKIKEELSGLRLELEAMDNPDLVTACAAEGVEKAFNIKLSDMLSPGARHDLIDQALRTRVPGAALVLGLDTLAIRLPTRKKEAEAA